MLADLAHRSAANGRPVIYQFGARFYSPTLGRFLSADTLVPQPFNPQELNRYSYVNNNPVNFTDPTGHIACEQYGGVCLTDTQMTNLWNSTHTTTTTTTTTTGGGDGGGGGTSGGDGGLLSPAPASGAVDVNYLDPTVNALYASPTSLAYSGSEPPNPSVWALVGIGIPLTLAVGLTEAALGLGEVSLASATLAQPELAIVTLPLELVLGTTSLAAGDLEVSYLAYSYRVLRNPNVHQDLILTPPWGL